ncbi:MAG: class I SAM-dependent methyltransferase [Candidatus Gracilibacteria bacterium]
MRTDSITILKNVKKTYDLIAEDFSKTRNTEWKEFEQFLPHIKNEQTLADIGCGNGRFFKFISKHKRVSYTGVDFSKRLLKEAKRLNKAKFIYGDILKIPLKPSSQDIIACIAVLHHIPTIKLRKKAVRELWRILKKKGTLLLTVWDLIKQKNCKKGDNFIPWGKEKIPRYYYAFEEKELEKLLLPHYKIIKKSHGKNLTYICEKL